MKRFSKIFITGGHVTPPLAVIEEIVYRYPDWQIFFVGRKYAMEGDLTVSEEYRIIRELGLPFLPLVTGRLQRRFTRYTIPSLLKIPQGLLQAWLYVREHKPDVIVTFGGYVGLPVVLAGWLLRIPIISQDETRSVGLANRLVSLLSAKICLSYGVPGGGSPKK